MTNFNSIFPHFIERCAELKQLLVPVAYLFLVGGIISSTITSHRSGIAYLRMFGKTIVLVMLLTFLVPWGNAITSIVDSTVKDVFKVDPAKIYDDYQAALEMKKSTEEDRSWWEKVFELRATMFEALLSVFLWLLGWIASAIVFYAYFVQKIVLFVGYALSPIFIGFLGISSLFDSARRYFLNLVGVMLWPLGWGVAGMITEGLIDFMTDQSFLHSQNSILGYEAYTLQNFIGVALLGIWLIFSTIAAPVVIQHSLSGGVLAASALLSGATSAGRAALSTGSSTGAVVARSGTGAASLGGAAAGTAAAIESLAGAATGTGAGSSIGTLATMSPLSASSAKAKRQRATGSSSFPPGDLTGDKTVAALLHRTRNPFTEG